MIKVFIGSALDPKEVMVAPAQTLRQAFTDNHLSVPSGAMLTHNGSRLGDRDLDKTFTDLNIVSGDSITIAEKLSSN